MTQHTTSRRSWRPALLFATLILGSALTLWLVPTASPMTVIDPMSNQLRAREISSITRLHTPQLKRTATNLTSAALSQANVTSRPPVPHPTSTPPTRVEVALTRRIERYLDSRGSPITGIPGFVRDAHLLGINPVAVIAISEIESSLGLAACGRNSTGLGACNRAWTVIMLCGSRYSLRDVHTWRQGLTLTARLLKCLWPSATSVYQLYGYCSGCPPWPGAVASVMRRMGSGSGIRWAHAQAAVR